MQKCGFARDLKKPVAGGALARRSFARRRSIPAHLVAGGADPGTSKLKAGLNAAGYNVGCFLGVSIRAGARPFGQANRRRFA